MSCHTDALITDFTDAAFKRCFRQYFAELGIEVRDWDGLFEEMNADSGNEAYIRTDANGNVIGFIQFIPIRFTSWFFEEVCGFLREFWISPEYRAKGHGAELLALAEKRFADNGIYTAILTTETAERFYSAHGYVKAAGCKAKNNDPVLIKRL